MIKNCLGIICRGIKKFRSIGNQNRLCERCKRMSAGFEMEKISNIYGKRIAPIHYNS